MLGATVALFLGFVRMVNIGMLGKRFDFTEEERAQGEHCLYLFRESGESPLSQEIDRRIGKQIDQRISVSLHDIVLGPLDEDGTRKLTVVYDINRIGQRVLPSRQAIGTMVNADCSVEFTVFQR